MLSHTDNELITRTGKGTLMGTLFRRYWLPALISNELEADGAPVRFRLLNEDLVAFRDTDGEVGILPEYCPHRGVSLALGRNEYNGLRCLYHGWKFDVGGQCVDMPTEPGGERLPQQGAGRGVRRAGARGRGLGIHGRRRRASRRSPSTTGRRRRTRTGSWRSGYRTPTGCRAWRAASTRYTPPSSTTAPKGR